MAKILYINGHPFDGSFHRAIQRAYLDGVGKQHEVKVLELGKLSFDPVLRYGYAQRMPEDASITASQELIKWADHIVFAFPIWWGDAPALMKGWIERVFTPGITYNLHGTTIDKHLAGKTADIITTSRVPRPLWWLFGNHGVSILTRNLFVLTGLKKRRVLTLGGIHFIPQLDTAKRREKFLRRVKSNAQKR